MSYPVYYVVAGDTLPVLFNTFDSNDPSASVTMTGLAVTDIEIYKDGSVTQRASDAGYTLLDTDGIDFDGITGIHGFSIDLSDNTDAGFFTVGPWYHVVVSAITVDAATINFIACAFRILDATRGMAGTALPDAAADAAGGLPISDAGGLDLDTFLGRITGNVALASVLGALADAAADGDPTASDTLMQYVKQVINTLVGTVGIPTFPAAAVAADGISLSEVIRSLDTRLPSALATGRIVSDTQAVSGDSVAADTLELFAEALDQATGQIDNGTLGTSLDTYQCKVELIDDDGSGNDRYSVVFFKNGEPITSGITVPKITVIKDADGTTLIAEDDLTEVGGLGHYRYTEGTDRVVSGAAYKAKITATIASATRSWFQPVGRDSTV